MAKECDLCLKVPGIQLEATAVVIPTRNAKGETLETPGVYFICLKCRQAIATAERAMKDQQRGG